MSFFFPNQPATRAHLASWIFPPRESYFLHQIAPANLPHTLTVFDPFPPLMPSCFPPRDHLINERVYPLNLAHDGRFLIPCIFPPVEGHHVYYVFSAMSHFPSSSYQGSPLFPLLLPDPGHRRLFSRLAFQKHPPQTQVWTALRLSTSTGAEKIIRFSVLPFSLLLHLLDDLSDVGIPAPRLVCKIRVSF